MLSLGSSVCESLLDGHQQLIPQRFIYKPAIEKQWPNLVTLSLIKLILLRNKIEHKKVL